MNAPLPDEKRLVHVKLCVVECSALTGWSTAALVFTDQSGDKAPRKVTLQIEHPNDIAYIRERLNDIETSWRRSLDSLKVTA